MIKPSKKYKDKQFNKLLQDNEKQILKIAQQIVNSLSFQDSFDLYLIPNGEDLKAIATSDDPKITCVICKRLMLLKAEYIAKKLDLDYIVTGEILGEQASQTINNLYNIQNVLLGKQLLRPIIGLNKEEVTKIARDIGTLAFSEKAAVFTCSAVPNKPVIQADLERIYKLEKKLEINKLAKNSISNAKKLTFHKTI
jgi:thiamine biosynthesis protein ThiI